jgi:hypothetical protein
MSEDAENYKTVFGVQGDQVVPIEARRVEGGWVVKQGCFRQFVEAEKLSETREGAEARLRMLNS